MAHEDQIIDSADVTEQANDTRQAVPMVDQTLKNLEAAGVKQVEGPKPCSRCERGISTTYGKTSWHCELPRKIQALWGKGGVARRQLRPIELVAQPVFGTLTWSFEDLSPHV